MLFLSAFKWRFLTRVNACKAKGLVRKEKVVGKEGQCTGLLSDNLGFDEHNNIGLLKQIKMCLMFGNLAMRPRDQNFLKGCKLIAI